ncbi:QueT transporter family protein [Enterococcus camelliae]|uniref:QueT transporter family protein n=1 Tax=Enterococcus camelliae TaxID=453959 RepID=A0ABW5TKV1_9ENTE
MQQKRNSSVRTIAGNAIIMALYVVLCFILPYQSGAIQFRLSESLNHLVVFNRKFIWGVFGGVVLYNLFFGYGPMDVIFGGGQTLLALLATIGMSRFVKNEKWRLVFNCLFFTASMFLIALMLMWTANLPFWPTYGTTALSEAIIMAISAPIMYGVNKIVKFEQRL